MESNIDIPDIYDLLSYDPPCLLRQVTKQTCHHQELPDTRQSGELTAYESEALKYVGGRWIFVTLSTII